MYVDVEFLSSLARRFQVGRAGDTEAEWFLCECWYWLYSSFPEHRCDIRLVLGGVLLNFRSKPLRSTRISPILETLGQIARGFQAPLLDVHRDLLTHILLPLHEPNQMAEWRDQLPILAEYHEPLVYIIVQILDKERSLTPEAVRSVLSYWPEGFQSNSAKEVLLLHELETLIHYIPADAFGSLVPLVVQRVLKCLSTENSRLVERSLYMWKDNSFLALLESQIKVVMKPIVSTLYRGGKRFWNPTVNKMTAAVLETMEKMDEVLFAQVSEEILKETYSRMTLDDGLKTCERIVTDSNSNRSSGKSYDSVCSVGHNSKAASAITTTSFMAAISAKHPPVTITGVAPWSFHQTRNPMCSAHKQRPNWTQENEGGHNPNKKQAKLKKSEQVGGGQAGTKLPPGYKGSITNATILGTTLENSMQKEVAIADGEEALNGLKQMKAHIESLKPANSCDGNEEGSWHADQMNPSPTRFPDLKFHNLVFGRDLGCGSFSRVCYARQIKRELPRSKWPEFAIKIMDMERLEANNYKVNASTEIAILTTLTHPGISRLISSFQWKGGVYLVLEYAERGDLQKFIAQYGSLNEESTRWVVGEIIETICYIHSSGFVYSDIKPENILITRSGHIKLVDFGAARPVSQQGRDVLYRSYLSLRKLRNGGWRTTIESADVNKYSQDNVDSISDEYNDKMNGVEEDERSACAELLQRVEGTAAYLPPEVARGCGRPGFPADAWALGCLMLQCLSGRPPILGDISDDDHVTLSHVVRFAMDEEQGLKNALSHLPVEVSSAARCLATSLLNTDPSPGNRITIEDSANHSWFTDVKLNVHNMYADPPPIKLLAGSITPQTNAAWNRRQNSMIWAPMPEPFGLQGERKSAFGVITEKEVERCGRFVKLANHIHKGMQLPPLIEFRPVKLIS